jgi:hypothetical protein
MGSFVDRLSGSGECRTKQDFRRKQTGRRPDEVNHLRKLFADDGAGGRQGHHTVQISVRKARGPARGRAFDLPKAVARPGGQQPRAGVRPGKLLLKSLRQTGGLALPARLALREKRGRDSMRLMNGFVLSSRGEERGRDYADLLS